jgi:hypothetical protein
MKIDIFSFFRSGVGKEKQPTDRFKRKELHYSLEPTTEEITFLHQHVSVHRHDWKLLLGQTKRSVTARNVLGYCAMNEFVFAGTLTVLNPFLGLIALISQTSSRESLSFLLDLVAMECEERLTADTIRIRTFEIHGGHCTVVELPQPIGHKEPALIGIVTDASMKQMQAATKESNPINIVYFSLAKGEDTICGLEEWKFREDVPFVEYQIKVQPDLEKFIDQIEKIMDEGGWMIQDGKREMKKHNLAKARKAFDKVLATEEAHFTMKVDAFISLGVIRAIESTEVISLPEVHFEYMIMQRYFCPTCKVRTENLRLSGSTQYLSRAIIDHWRASCPVCKTDRRLRFAVPPS